MCSELRIARPRGTLGAMVSSKTVFLARIGGFQAFFGEVQLSTWFQIGQARTSLLSIDEAWRSLSPSKPAFSRRESSKLPSSRMPSEKSGEPSSPICNTVGFNKFAALLYESLTNGGHRDAVFQVEIARNHLLIQVFMSAQVLITKILVC